MHLTKIQLSDIATALEDHSGMTWYWDREAGEAIPLTVDFSWEEAGLEEDPEENPDRFLLIEQLDSRKGFRCMERYLEEVPEGECRRELFRALRGPRPFAVFKGVLQDFPEEREAWFAFRDAWMMEEVREFVRLHDLGTLEEEDGTGEDSGRAANQ